MSLFALSADPSRLLLDELKTFVREKVPEHLQGLFNSDSEVQLIFGPSPEFPEGKKVRVPKDGKTDPNYHDTANHPPVASLTALGVSGWNWADGRTYHVTIDLDGLNHGDERGHDQATLDDLKSRLLLVPQVEIIYSKSGRGLHLRVYFDPDNAPHSRTRDDHIAQGQDVLKWLANVIGQDLVAKADCVGVIAWIYHDSCGPEGFKLLKRSTAFMPEDWDRELPRKAAEAKPEHTPAAVTPKHQTLIDYLVQRGHAEWQDGRLTTHTYLLALAAEDKSLKIAKGYATIATGKEGANDRNCFAYPAEDGSWRVYRFGKGTKEHKSWWTSASGWMTCFLNRDRGNAEHPTTAVVRLAKQDELFHDSSGRTYATTKIGNVLETVPITDGRYRRKMRLAYTQDQGVIISNDYLSNAIQQIEAIAEQERPEFPVALRVAEHDGTLFIDLADADRRVVRVTPQGWSVDKTCPVRFMRPHGMLPLPVPLSGGSLAEFRQFVNVEDDDLPLLLAFMVGTFCPHGSHTLLQICGEQGSSKSSTMRFAVSFTDPQVAVGNTLPTSERDLLVAAQSVRVYTADNVDALNRKTQSWLCMLCTGAASSNRKLFTDADVSILKAKRPIMLTAIGNVVTAPDLLDRTLTIVLPVIPPEKRKSEFAIEQALRRDGVRGRLFGFVLDGVVAALAGHAQVKRDDMPRMADLFAWATAAESGLSLPTGSVIESYQRQIAEESCHVQDDPLAKELMTLCAAGWKGTPTQLAERLPHLDLTGQQISNRTREIAPDLRRSGNIVEWKKRDGVRLIVLGRAA